MRQHLGTHRNGKLKVSDIYKIDEDLRGFFLSKVNCFSGFEGRIYFGNSKTDVILFFRSL